MTTRKRHEPLNPPGRPESGFTPTSFQVTCYSNPTHDGGWLTLTLVGPDAMGELQAKTVFSEHQADNAIQLRMEDLIVEGMTECGYFAPERGLEPLF